MDIALTTLVENTAGSPLLFGEWGQSLLIETDGQKILFDTGPTGLIIDNAAKLRVDLSAIDKIVLSHGHYDHTGGLKDVLNVIKKSGSKLQGVEIIAHPDIFGNKYYYVKGLPERFIGIPFTRQELEDLGARFNLSERPVQINDRIITTGEVQLSVDYEKIDPALHIRAGDSYIPDKLADDLAIIIKAEHGMIVLLGCSHRGIINTLLHAQKLTSIKDIYAVIGGTHLINADKNQLDSTISALKGFSIKKLGVSHCTGLKSAAILAGEFEDTFFFNSAGTKTLL